MQTYTIKTQTDSNGHLILDLKTSFLNQEMEVLVVVQEKKIEDKNKYNFSDLVGSVKWEGDALEFQKNIRSEWK